MASPRQRRLQFLAADNILPRRTAATTKCAQPLATAQRRQLEERLDGGRNNASGKKRRLAAAPTAGPRARAAINAAAAAPPPRARAPRTKDRKLLQPASQQDSLPTEPQIRDTLGKRAEICPHCERAYSTSHGLKTHLTHGKDGCRWKHCCTDRHISSIVDI
eukprot:COSAG01_NODE_9031_length_2576_cov_87.507469_2_plen_161_part_01